MWPTPLDPCDVAVPELGADDDARPEAEGAVGELVHRSQGGVHGRERQGSHGDVEDRHREDLSEGSFPPDKQADYDEHCECAQDEPVE